MSGVVLLFTVALLAAVSVYLLRRWPLPAVAVAGSAALMLGAMLWRWPNGTPVLFLGRTVRLAQPMELFGQRLEMGSPAQWVVGFLAFLLAVTYLGAWRVSQGRSFFPFGLVVLALLSSVLFIQPLWLAPTQLAAVVSLTTLVIQAGRQGSTRGATRVMWLPVLAIPLFLLASWHLDQVPLDPDNPLPLQSAARLASWGLVLLLAPWPLHGPALSLGEEAPPLVAAWLLSALAALSVTLLHAFLVRYPWLQGAPLVFWLPAVRLSNLLLWGGLAASLWAGLAAAVQRDLGRLWSYAALYSFGTVLVALGLGARSTWGLVWLILLSRSLGLLVSGFGLAVIRDRAGSRTNFDSIRGLATRLPLASSALLLGGLSLAGVPLTAGFTGQWALLQAVGSRDWIQAVVLLLGALGLCAGLLRSQRVLLGRLENLLLEREDLPIMILAAAGLLALVVTGLWPQAWEGPLTAVVTLFSASG